MSSSTPPPPTTALSCSTGNKDTYSPLLPGSSVSQACTPQSARAQPRPHQHEHAESVDLQASYPPRVRHRLSPCSFKRPRLRTSCPYPWPSTLRRIVPSLEIPAARRWFGFGWRSQARRFVCCCCCCCLIRLTRKLRVCLAAVLVSVHVATASRALSLAAASTEQRNMQVRLSTSPCSRTA
jgi:hypothetical protein